MASFSKNNVGEEIFDTIKGLLICAKCQRTPILGQPRWYRCTKLHQICQDCKEVKRESKCICNQPISKDFCQMTEALLSMKSMQFKCKNVPQGCEALLDAEAIIRHEPDCIFRLVQCPKTSCKLLIPIDKLFEHMEENGHCFVAYAITRDLALILRKTTLLTLHLQVRSNINKINYLLHISCQWKFSCFRTLL